MNDSNNSARIIVLVAIILIGGGALAYSILGKKTETPQPQATSQSNENATTTAAASNSSSVSVPSNSASSYKDGVYSATGSYLSPGGTEKLGVSITLKNDIITDASVTPAPVSPEGSRFQSIFQQNFKQYVVGKNIDSVNLTKVSGSSLTPIGFNNAISQIETQAKG